MKLNMDEYLFTKFIFPFKPNLKAGIYKTILLSAQDKLECSHNFYYNYYPQPQRGIQLVLETNKQNEVKALMFHHTSDTLWKLKIISRIDDNIYLVHSIYNNAIFPIRLVNAQVLGGELKENNYIMAQISAFAIDGKIYKNKDEYKDEIDLNDFGILTNIKGTIKKVASYKLWMYFIDLPQYYCLILDYNNEEIPIFIPNDFISSKITRFGKGNYFAGNILISGDVCLDKYEKYIKDNDYIS